MNCKDKDMPLIALMVQVMHQGKDSAKLLFHEYDLKPWQAGILFVLHESGGLSQRELAERLHLTPPTVTSGIQKMEKMGYIERRPDENDKRAMRLNVTEKSKVYMEHVVQVVKQVEDTMLGGMSVEEKLLLKRLLLQMRDNMKDYNKRKGLEV